MRIGLANLLVVSEGEARVDVVCVVERDVERHLVRVRVRDRVRARVRAKVRA